MLENNEQLDLMKSRELNITGLQIRTNIVYCWNIRSENFIKQMYFVKQI